MSGLSFRPGSPGRLAIAAVIAAAVLILAGYFHLGSVLTSATISEIVDVTAPGVSDEIARRLTVSGTSPDGEHDWEMSRYGSLNRWRTIHRWVKELRINGAPADLERIGSLVVRVGPHSREFQPAELSRWQRVQTSAVLLPVQVPDAVSLQMPGDAFPRFHPRAINWPESESSLVIMLGFLYMVPLLVLIAAGFCVAARREGFRAFVERAFFPAQTPDAGEGKGWLWLGLAATILALGFLEWRQPFYFTQDDNLAQFLPVIVEGCRSALEGVAPLWNPYQSLGSPVMTIGTYALTYPLTYVAYFIARFVLRNPYLTIEVFAIIHVLLAYFSVYAALRSCALRRDLAALGALCLAVSGFSLVFGRSWYYMLPVFVWAPLLVLALNRLQRGARPLPWIAGTGIVIGVFYHAGNVQMWIYALLFFSGAAALLFWARALSFARLIWAAAAMLIGAGIAAPLFIPQSGEATGLDRVGGLGSDIGSALPHLLLPLGKLVEHPSVWLGPEHSYRGEMFFAGGVFFLAALAGWTALFCLTVVCGNRPEQLRALVRENVWLICALAAALCAMGGSGVVWPLMAHLPPFNKFNVPAKYLAYVNLFAAAGGGIILERILARSSAAKRLAVVLAASALLIVHLAWSKSAFYNYAVWPYPGLPPSLAAQLASEPGARVIPVAPERNPGPGYYNSLSNNFPTVARMASIEGYDPLVAAKKQSIAAWKRLDRDPAAAASAYGVRWMLIYQPENQWEFGPDANAWPMETIDAHLRRMWYALENRAVLVEKTPQYELYRLSPTEPPAFVEGGGTAVSVQFGWSGARVEVGGVAPGTPVIVNALYRPWMKARAGAAELSLAADAWGRIRFAAPAGGTEVRIVYAPPFLKGAGAGAVLILAGLFLAAACARRQLPHSS